MAYGFKKVFLIKNRLFILVNQTSHLRQKCLLSIAARWNELLVMADQGTVV